MLLLGASKDCGRLWSRIDGSGSRDFLLLHIALQAPLLAALAIATNLLATGAARLIFQDGHGEGLLGFESQGFLDAWAPVFFFAMIFALAMDYTVFLLGSGKEHCDRSGDARKAAIGGLAQSGRVIFAASGATVAIFFTFALSGPCPRMRWGVILGLTVLLDQVVRLLLLPVLLRLSDRAAWWLPRTIVRWLPKIRFRALKPGLLGFDKPSSTESTRGSTQPARDVRGMRPRRVVHCDENPCKPALSHTTPG